MKSGDICEEIENDEFYSDFIQNLEQKSANLRGNEHVAPHIEKLSYGLDLLSTELQNKIREQHAALLTQASHAGQLDGALETVKSHISSIQGGAKEIKSQIARPYSALKSQTQVLCNLHTASHILQKICWFLKMYCELKSLTDTAKQAEILSELEVLCDDTTISNLDAIKEERSDVLLFRQRVLTGATRDLQSGLKDHNSLQIQASLQIFSNLNYLQPALDSVFSTLHTDVEQIIRRALESGLNVTTTNTNSSLGEMKSEKSQILTGQAYKIKLWVAMDNLFSEGLYEPCRQVELLEQVLSQLNLSLHNKNVMDIFWDKLHSLLGTGFKNASARAWQSLELELPRLLGAANILEGKLGRRYIFKSELFQPFETGYIKRCQSNLHACFQNISIPTCDTVDVLIRTSTTELSAAIVNKSLSGNIVMLVNSANAAFWELLETGIKKTPEAAQIVDSPNALQLINISLANVVHYHGEQIRNLVVNLGNNLPEAETERLIADLTKGEALINNIVQPLKKSIESSLYAILISLHQDPSLNNSTSTTGPSLYMRELQQFIARVGKTHLSPYNDFKTISKCCQELAVRCIEQFVFNVSCVRPLTKIGRKKLILDCGHLESALKPFVNDLAQLGAPYRSLRALSVILDIAPQAVTLDGTLRASTVLLLLFSHAGPELVSPHVALGWSIEKLSTWWEGHTSERDRLELISGALQKYQTTVRQKKNTHYDPIYPILSQLLKTSST